MVDENQKALDDQEKKLRKEFQERLDKEINYLKDSFDFILQNEQVRTSHMLREAQRDRNEKITALQNQLECKNMAGLMYVLCTERVKNKLEKMRMVEEYTNYISALQDILKEGQDLILYLSLGYKTAARVDHEWKEKMKKIIFQFQNFVRDFTGGTAEDIQHFFDLPTLLKVSAPVEPDPNEDPCENYNQDICSDGPEPEKTWWELLDAGDDRPFVVFGDMADFKPPQRREVLKNVKAAKTAPKKWKQYVFNEMFINSDCANANVIKDEYSKHLPVFPKWECQGVQTHDHDSFVSHRFTTTSVDVRGNMGSILKMITASMCPRTERTGTRATLLGARDSMEIASSTKLLEKHKDGHSETASEKVILNVGQKRTSILKELADEINSRHDEPMPEVTANEEIDDDEDETSKSIIGSQYHDSLQIMQDHIPDRDSKINYEKVCPMDKCQRLRTDSFMRSLPAYMRASQFHHFEQTFDGYEPCTPEQLKILKRRIEEKAQTSAGLEKMSPEDVLEEWKQPVEGVAVQTSLISLPPCTCEGAVPSSDELSQVMVYKLEDLFPIKKALDNIKKECLFDDKIEFNRFKVLGEETYQKTEDVGISGFQSRLIDVKKVLNQYPSLCSLFQANAMCQ